MKKLVALIAALLLLGGCARADIVGSDGNGGYIHRFSAPNGQDIFFVSDMEEPAVSFEDVNFDGADDIVVTTAQGASNAFYEFFVFDEGRYVMAEHPGSGYGVPNYWADPETGRVSAWCNNGYAGLLHSRYVYRWEGTDLRLVRKAVSSLVEEWSSEDNRLITVTYNDTVRRAVYAYDAGEYDYEGEPVWETTVRTGELTDGKTDELFAQEEAWLFG